MAISRVHSICTYRSHQVSPVGTGPTAVPWSPLDLEGCSVPRMTPYLWLWLRELGCTVMHAQ